MTFVVSKWNVGFGNYISPRRSTFLNSFQSVLNISYRYKQLIDALAGALSRGHATTGLDTSIAGLNGCQKNPAESKLKQTE